MDLSAVIFVVLAVAWAVYLIPKALKHHDELASDRLVEGHSDKVRILARHGKVTETRTEVVVEDIAPAQVADEPEARRRGAPSVVTRTSARKAAQRRRRVLGMLLVALAAVWTLTWFAYLPIWAPALPGALVVGWLVLARLSVRQQQARRRVPAVEEAEAPVVSAGIPVEAPTESQDLVDLLAEDTTGLRRQEIEAALADDGSLWDPLPLTLPTYVNKARARRTVRTIELTGINSSGHDQADTTLAREATEQTPESTAPRKAAGA